MGHHNHHHDRHKEAHEAVHSADNKHSGHWSHELIAGAAAFAAMKHHEDATGGKHKLTKEIFAALAAAEADKIFETKGLDFIDRQKAKHETEKEAKLLYDERYGDH
ncbi:hypothetical protein BGZ83_010306 [Gryganskiella cystojenkinii]|nr:hypothetical protein BGZ83_010306 [Gryganskiella cystojenkinii]